ncbi:hypothetical protein [Methylocystis echinoides]|uniref:Uncharacterized protein n=1 Tax=Methylocystis echinoides TaxID=29468 RepID=A0A9W6LTR5_9HYPH|nr:hypothetical protein [Methylocystis echinoides]GLI94776.1 hypothetical protein LMG27198_37680 [Methylocystis echinoides]
MSLLRPSLVAAGLLAAALAGASAAQAGGPNVAVCLALQNEFGKCVNNYQRQPRRGWDGGGYDRGYGGGGYGGGYGGRPGGGYGGQWGDDGDGWRRPRPQRGGDAAAACQGWLIQMKAANCF